MVYNKMAAICPDFKWLGFRISDPIQIQTICNPTCFSLFEIQTSLDLRSPCIWVMPMNLIPDKYAGYLGRNLNYKHVPKYCTTEGIQIPDTQNSDAFVIFTI